MQKTTAPSVIGVLGMGAMGAGVAADLTGRGVRVVTTLAGRSSRTEQRARAARAEVLDSLDDVLAVADTFLSIVPADQAWPLAEAVAARLDGRRVHFVDCNSITPSKALGIAMRLREAGATVSDGGIIGPPPGGKVRTRVYVSGPHCGDLLPLQSERLAVLPLGESLSQATEMKVLFAAANKGATALLANVLAAARTVGLLDQVVGEIDAIRPGLLGCVRNAVPELGEKAARWAVEMEDLAEGLAEMGTHGGYHRAAADSYRRLAANLPDAAGEADAMQRVLSAWVGSRPG